MCQLAKAGEIKWRQMEAREHFQSPHAVEKSQICWVSSEPWHVGPCVCARVRVRSWHTGLIYDWRIQSLRLRLFWFCLQQPPSDVIECFAWNNLIHPGLRFSCCSGWGEEEGGCLCACVCVPVLILLPNWGIICDVGTFYWALHQGCCCCTHPMGNCPAQLQPTVNLSPSFKRICFGMHTRKVPGRDHQARGVYKPSWNNGDVSHTHQIFTYLHPLEATLRSMLPVVSFNYLHIFFLRAVIRKKTPMTGRMSQMGVWYEQNKTHSANLLQKASWLHHVCKGLCSSSWWWLKALTLTSQRSKQHLCLTLLWSCVCKHSPGLYRLPLSSSVPFRGWKWWRNGCDKHAFDRNKNMVWVGGAVRAPAKNSDKGLATYVADSDKGLRCFNAIFVGQLSISPSQTLKLNQDDTSGRLPEFRVKCDVTCNIQLVVGGYMFDLKS